MTITVTEQHIQVQAKSTKFINIQEDIGEIDRWIVENPNTPIKLYHPPSIEIKVDYASLNCLQQAEQRANKEASSSLTICSQLHKAT
jgi:hypothetical protein